MNPIDKFEWKANWAAEKAMLEYVIQLVKNCNTYKMGDR